MATPKKTTGPKPKKGYKPSSESFVSKDSKDNTVNKNRYTTINDKGKRDYISSGNIKYNFSNNKTPTSVNKEKTYIALKNSKPTYSTSTETNYKKVLDKPKYTVDFKKSMDTTGYAAGKKQFTVNSITNKPGELSKTKSAKVNRSQVNPTLDKWKSAASKMKVGGAVKKTIIKSKKK
jgi:hypothetical protein